MTPYVDCVFAQRHLEAFVDLELSLADQVLVESHLRWCSTCAARMEDMQLLRSAVRTHTRHRDGLSERDATAQRLALLDRVDTERRRSVGVRLREMAQSCLDLRFVWPAVGASAALVVCVGLAAAMWESAVVEQPTSLAAMIESLADPGSNRNPMRLDGAIVVPRVLSDRGAVAHAVLDARSGEDEVVAVATVVTREGRIGTYELLQAGSTVSGRWTQSRGEEEVADLLDAVRHSRFAPAQAPGGRAVAVNMLWLFAKTTVRGSAMPLDLGVPLVAPISPVVVRPRDRAFEVPPRVPAAVAEPTERRSEVVEISATA